MSSIRIHYDGWLTLPAEARKYLDVANGDRLNVELVDGSVVLRPAGQAKPTADSEAEAEPEPEPLGAQATAMPKESAPAVETAAPKRGPGRPRKLVGPDPVPGIKVGGRRKSAPPS